MSQSAGFCNREQLVLLQTGHEFALIEENKTPQLSHTFTLSKRLTIYLGINYCLKVFINHKLSTDILNGITRKLSIMKYKQCPKSDNPFDVDIYETNGMGFDEVVHCCSKKRVRKSREVKRY